MTSTRKGSHPQPQDYNAIRNKTEIGDDTDLDIDDDDNHNIGDDEEEALPLAFDESDDRYSSKQQNTQSHGIRGEFVRRVCFFLCMIVAIVVCAVIVFGNKSNDPSSSGTPISTATCNSKPAEPFQIHYEPKLPSWDILSTSDNRDPDWIFPVIPSFPSDSNTDSSTTESSVGYFMQPHISNGRMVFVSEGDMFYCDLNTPPPISAVRLTVTVGNVRNPKLHPRIPYYLAYTATYDSIREVYLYDMRSRISKRLTYTDTLMGIDSMSDWGEIEGENNNNTSVSTIVYAKVSDRVSLRDVRLYQLALNGTMVLEEIPIPLAQAIDGVSYTFQNKNKRNNQCWYFVRNDQFSWTNRYVGGTVPNIWAYCSNRTRAVPLWKEYNGTSKSPQIATLQGKPYLFFLSDRARSTASLTSKSAMPPPTSMELWATELPSEAQLYDRGGDKNFTWLPAVPLTRVYCQFGGWPVREYSVDRSTGDVVLRIGADLYRIDKTDIVRTLTQSSSTSSSDDIVPRKIDLAVPSDFHELQERQVSVHIPRHLSTLDVFATSDDDDTSGPAVLMTIRGQLWVAPVIAEASTKPYQGAGQNLPLRRYRVLPGAMTAGAVRVLASRHIPLYSVDDEDDSDDDGDDEVSKKRQFALVLATDPLSPTAEHAFFIVEIQSNVLSQFEDLEHWPDPIVGGRLGGGATTANGGLGSVIHKKMAVSPCGRRFAWTDTDDRICVMTVPLYYNATTKTTTTVPPNPFQCLPKTNNLGEPMAGTLADLVWSPGGRYLAVTHNALNQFNVISLVDCGSPLLFDENSGNMEVVDIEISSIVQVTPSRFNSYEVVWGKSTLDIFLQKELKSKHEEYNFATTLYFISDRDVVSDVVSPWGSRAPMPHFERLDGHIYALPLPIKTEDGTIAVDSLIGRFAGGGALEVFDLEKVSKTLKKMTKSDDGKTENTDSQPNNRKRFRAKLARFLQRLRLKGSKLQETSTEAPSMSPTILNNSTIEDPFPKDAELDLTNEDSDFSLPRKAYRLAHLPRGKYFTILSQTTDDGSLVVIEQNDDTSSPILRLFAADSFPSDTFESKSGDTTLSQWGLSTCRRYIHLVSSTGKVTVISNTETGVSALLRDTEWTENLADVDDMAISVWPTLEYRQMYGDAWRLLRDYFYDTNMHNVDWKEMFRRYEPLVRRCAKREDLDDVLGMLIAELSALHSFVYGGEYHTPDRPPWSPASLGAAFRRAPEWKGYEVIDVPLRDPDFNVLDGRAQYCPISDQALRPTGQRGLQIGDIIIAVNGESVMHGPGLNYRLRGMAGRSVRLEVLRLGSGNLNDTASVIPESLVTVPITGPDADDLRYGAWEWKTRQLAKQLAAEAGFSVGYVHMQAMTRDGFDAFARGFFPDYDKDALIIDVRHNLGGNIDSWILTYLQRQAWSFWAGRGVNERNGDLDWDAQFAFRGKVVVLVDERTGSNGEGVARAISELGLGRIIGKRTWGGGIWGSSSNRLVDGGIASAPQWGVYNDKLGWGAGVEMTGVDPEIVIDNDPRLTFDGRDEQLERAISELSSWLKKSPIPEFQVAIERPDMSLKLNNCPA